jgi:metal-responsive CopG/Arc/MetJ family transcriptional regulator
MKKNRSQGRSRKTQRESPVRASITFPPGLYESLEEIAKRKKVSLAWVVRDAAESYVGDARVRQSRAHVTVVKEKRYAAAKSQKH